MSLTTFCLLAALCPQDPGRGRLVLPPPAAPLEVAPPPVTQLSPAERLYQDAVDLRQSAHLSASAEDLILARVCAEYERPAALALGLARQASDDVLYGLLRIVERCGTGQDADHLQVLLLTRPFGSATRDGVQALAKLAGAGAKKAMLACFTSRYAGVRKAATDLLLARIDASDLGVLLELSRDDKVDIRRRALFLLAALPLPEAQQRLLEALSDRDPTIAGAAASSLVQHGPEVAPLLQEVVERPATGRQFGYCAFALAQLEDHTGRQLLREAAVPHLRAELVGSDPFLRATSALALANLSFRSPDSRASTYGDRDIVEGLMLVVAPRGYVSNMSMLQHSATQKLVQFTGVDFRGRNEGWHAWWERARSGFVGTRLAIDLDAERAATAVLTWTTPQRTYRFFGELAPEPAPAAAADAEESAAVDDFRLSAAELAALVARLREHGFMTQGLLATAAAELIPAGRALELTSGEARCRIAGPAAPARWLDVLASDLEAVAERERWQLYPDPRAESKLAFWRAERARLAGLTDRADRDRCLKERILAAYPSLSPTRRARALQHLLALPNLGALLTAADGLALVECIEAAESMDEERMQLAEIAVLAPGEDTWRRLLAAAEHHFERGGEQALPRLFALLGPERIRAVAADGSTRLRTAAMMECANLADLAAVPTLLAALTAPERDVRETAIYALGKLGAAEARKALLALEADPQTEPSTRRVAWVALARIGGEEVFPILQSAVASPALEDQLAAIQALGELQEPRSANLLAHILVGNGLNARGTRAMTSLQKLGGLLACPALRQHLGVRDPRVRREVVDVLAEFQDPSVVPDLIASLQIEPERLRSALQLSAITGVDLSAVDDRFDFMKQWWRTNKDLPQASWFLDSLQRHGMESTLTAADLAPGVGYRAVPELTRIMLATDVPHLRVLAAALLRNTTDRDFGPVSMNTTPTRLQAVADRYRFYADAERAAHR